MNCENELKKMGIEVLERVEDKNIMRVSRKVSHRLAETFPKCDFRYMDIYRALINTPMMYAKFPEGFAKVNYFYKNSTLYFSKEFDFHDIKRYIFHECIHRLQEKKDKKNKIVRFGICEVNDLSIKGAALNEGAIQYIVDKAAQSEEKIIQVYGISMQSRTNYYPVLTCLITQLAFLLGEDILVDSTIRANEEFKIAIIDNLGERTYHIIEKKCDKILNMKNYISILQKDFDKNERAIFDYTEKIRKIFYEVQGRIFKSYFKNMLKMTESKEEVQDLIERFEQYEKLIGTDVFYDDFNEFKKDFTKNAQKKILKVSK